tara:strand:+ start:8361 stop:8729 length:369 start_codon:yes stop_codon:yes gene_type:complete
MATLGVKLPITKDSIHGYTMISDFHSLIKQNLKMLILTNPGERVMIPDFGVGIQSYLFENFSESTYVEIENNIRSQVQKYLPVVTIGRLSFDNSSPDTNTLGVSLQYSIPALNVKDLLEFTI